MLHTWHVHVCMLQLQVTVNDFWVIYIHVCHVCICHVLHSYIDWFDKTSHDIHVSYTVHDIHTYMTLYIHYTVGSSSSTCSLYTCSSSLRTWPSQQICWKPWTWTLKKQQEKQKNRHKPQHVLFLVRQANTTHKQNPTSCDQNKRSRTTTTIWRAGPPRAARWSLRQSWTWVSKKWPKKWETKTKRRQLLQSIDGYSIHNKDV